MSRCLGERALLRVLEREPARREEAHLRSCAGCRTRLRRLQQDLDQLTAVLHGPPPPLAAPPEATGWRLGLALPVLALAAAGLALVLHGRGPAATAPGRAPDATTAAADPLGASGLAAALEGGDPAWSGGNDGALAADADEIAALRAALHGARPCAADERMLFASCDETALADWSPVYAGEEVGR
jgi:hypothetical protein